MEHKNKVSIISSILIHLVALCVFITNKIMFTSAFYSNDKENIIQVNFLQYNETTVVRSQPDHEIKKVEKTPVQKEEIKKVNNKSKKETPQSSNIENKLQTQKSSKKNNIISDELTKKPEHTEIDKKVIDPPKEVEGKKDHNSIKKDKDADDSKKPISEDTNAPKSQSIKEDQVSIDKRALYDNKKSRSQGAMLEMQGWTWDNIPVPTDTTKEVGILIFEISVNQYGEIIKIHTLERTVSLKVEAIYREALESITFSKTDDKDLSKTSKGKVTFFIQYR